ncbi:META domain-containing protein [Devosia ginsengisoli]|uniref:META domain-containing protein n=1 Tax=Devosia ginsengisoli TaxID=400770 RepID=A0A5B8LUV5_9HYPH|nr:META domain-containing protein [Devosia ginsengisoli]QDZ11140.1 META domain-containing protein [Devosia ginsengisoli]
MLPTRLTRFALALLALLMAAPAFAEDVTFTGLVSWRERMALPPDAALTVNLVTMPGQQRITGAHASLGGKAGSPIQFTLNVRSDVLAGGGSFGLVAEIRSQGYVIFRNWQPVPVDALMPSGILIPVEFSPPPPHDPPEQVLPPVEAPNPLLDVVWTLTSIGSDPVLADTAVTFSIAADHRAGGNGGCNNYFTEASFEGPPLSFGPVAGTRRACAPDIMTQEARFFAALAATRGYELAGNGLQLVDAAGVALAGLVQTP